MDTATLFYLSYELMHSSQSAEKRLYSSTRGSIGQGSVPYYHFLKNTNLHNAPQILTRLKEHGPEHKIKHRSKQLNMPAEMDTMILRLLSVNILKIQNKLKTLVI